MNRRLRSLTVVAGVLAAMAVPVGAGSASTPASELTDTLRIGVGIDAAYAPFFVAAAQGYFEDEGLTNVELVQFARGGEAVDALGAGQLDLAGNSDTTTLVLMGNNPIFRALLIYQESGEYLKVVARGDITDVSEIHTMGVVPGLSAYNAELFVADAGLQDVQYVEAAPAEIPALMQRGDIDAYILWEPWPTQGVELGGQILGTTGDFGSSYVHWLVATDSWLGDGDHMEYAGAVARALDTASGFVESHPDETAAITEDAAQIPPDQTVQAIDQIDFAVRGFGDDDFASYERQNDYLVAHNMVDAPVDLDAAIDTDFFATTGLTDPSDSSEPGSSMGSMPMDTSSMDTASMGSVSMTAPESTVAG